MKKKLIYLLFLYLFFNLGTYTEKVKSTPVSNPILDTITIHKPYTTFTPENLMAYIFELNIRFPHIVYAQAIQETGFFTSNIFIESNNLFGMKQAKMRPTTALGTQRGHAYYREWKDSVKDYALWQAAYANTIRNEKQYYAYLDKVYAEDPDYVLRLKYIVNSQDLLALN